MNDQPELSPEQRAKLKAELLAELKAELKQDQEQPEPEKPEKPEPEPEPPTKPVEGNNEPTTKDTPELSKYDKYIMEKRAENKRAEEMKPEPGPSGEKVLMTWFFIIFIGGGALFLHFGMGAPILAGLWILVFHYISKKVLPKL